MRRFLLCIVIVCITCAVSVSVISIVSGEQRRPFTLSELFYELTTMDYGIDEFHILLSELDYIWNGLSTDATYGLDKNLNGKLEKSEIDLNGDGIISTDEYDLDRDGTVSDAESRIIFDATKPFDFSGSGSDVVDSVYNVLLTIYKIISFMIHGLVEIIRYVYLYLNLIYKCLFGVPVA